MTGKPQYVHLDDPFWQTADSRVAYDPDEDDAVKQWQEDFDTVDD